MSEMTDEEFIPGKSVYVAVCCDSSIDDRITLHRTREGADEAVNVFIDEYGHDLYGDLGDGSDYVWAEHDLSDQSDDRNVVRIVDTTDDGPWARIELLVLEP